MAEGVYICTVYRDRPHQWRWLLDPKVVETFKTVLDLADTRSLDSALARAAKRDRGDDADVDMYRLEVTAPDGTILSDWRYNDWGDQPAPEPYGLDAYGYGR